MPLFNKYEKEQLYLVCKDGSKVEVDPPQYRPGDLVESNSEYDTLILCEVGRLYQWVDIPFDSADTSTYICDGVDLYALEKQQYSDNSGVTWVDSNPLVTQKGELLHEDWYLCGGTQYPPIYEWVDIPFDSANPNTYVCDGVDLYTAQKKQVSTDNGITWTDVIPLELRKGTIIMKNVKLCGGEYYLTLNNTLTFILDCEKNFIPSENAEGGLFGVRGNSDDENLTPFTLNSDDAFNFSKNLFDSGGSNYNAIINLMQYTPINYPSTKGQFYKDWEGLGTSIPYYIYLNNGYYPNDNYTTEFKEFPDTINFKSFENLFSFDNNPNNGNMTNPDISGLTQQYLNLSDLNLDFTSAENISYMFLNTNANTNDIELKDINFNDNISASCIFVGSNFKSLNIDNINFTSPSTDFSYIFADIISDEININNMIIGNINNTTYSVSRALPNNNINSINSLTFDYFPETIWEISDKSVEMNDTFNRHQITSITQLIDENTIVTDNEDLNSIETRVCGFLYNNSVLFRPLHLNNFNISGITLNNFYGGLIDFNHIDESEFEGLENYEWEDNFKINGNIGLCSFFNLGYYKSIDLNNIVSNNIEACYYPVTFKTKNGIIKGENWNLRNAYKNMSPLWEIGKDDSTINNNKGFTYKVTDTTPYFYLDSGANWQTLNILFNQYIVINTEQENPSWFGQKSDFIMNIGNFKDGIRLTLTINGETVNYYPENANFEFDYPGIINTLSFDSNTQYNTIEINKDLSECTKFAFSNQKLITLIDFSNINITDNLNNLMSAFNNCNSAEEIKVNNFITNNVTTFYGCFSNCSSLINLDISNWNFDSATETQRMFMGCASLNSLNISNFNPSNKLTSVSSMFVNCSSLQNITCTQATKDWIIANKNAIALPQAETINYTIVD